MITFRVFDPKTATSDEWAAINQLDNLWLAERLPDDPPTPVEDTQRMWLSIPPILRICGWHAWTTAGEAVASANVQLLDMEENRHVAQGALYVHPDYRRQGLGKQLFARIIRAAADDQRRVCITSVVDRVPAGMAFAQKIGMQVGLATHINQLNLAELDRHLIKTWQEGAAERAGGFELLFIEGDYPEDQIEEIAVVIQAMNQAPRGDLDFEDMRITPEFLRHIEQSLKAQNRLRWTYVAREKATGKLAGFTEVIWNPSKPLVGNQGDTGVLEKYRNLGLGRWLKAAMLQKVIDEKPQVRFIRTGNADSNEPMLKINNQLGFHPYMANSLCQVSIEQAQEYLTSRGL